MSLEAIYFYDCNIYYLDIEDILKNPTFCFLVSLQGTIYKANYHYLKTGEIIELSDRQKTCEAIPFLIKLPDYSGVMVYLVNQETGATEFKTLEELGI